MSVHPDHLKGVFVTSSQNIAKEMWKLLKSVPFCACKKILQRKGVCVGWQNGNKERMVKSVKVFMMEYWKNQGLLNDITCIQFKEDIEKISFLINI